MHLVITTFYDGHDYRSVDEIFYVDESGENVLHKEATEACDGQNICADMGDFTYEVLEEKVRNCLAASDIDFEVLEFEYH